MTSDKSEANKAQKLLELSGDIGSNVLGAAIGLIAAGPGGAIAGAVIAPPAKHAITRVLVEAYERVTGVRARVRVGTAASIALAQIADGIARGRELRQDNFFSEVNGSTPAEQIFEGVLLKCRDSFET